MQPEAEIRVCGCMRRAHHVFPSGLAAGVVLALLLAAPLFVMIFLDSGRTHAEHTAAVQVPPAAGGR